MKIKAFTILESLISLILLGIIIGLVFTLLNLINKQVVQFNGNNSDELNYNFFDLTIQKDIYEAYDYSISGNNLLLINYDDSNIGYEFSNNHITRTKNAIKDTFRLKVKDYRYMPIGKLDSQNNIVLMNIDVMGANIKANYFLYKDKAKLINDTFYNED